MKVEKERRRVVFLAVVAAVLVPFVALIALSHVTYGSTAEKSTISLQNFSICSANCNYPSPYMFGEVYVNAHSPLYSLQISISGNPLYTKYFHNQFLNYVYQFKTVGFASAIVSGDSYSVQFIATFNDNSTWTASAEVVAN
jgi:hypothetical protein